jgi:glutamine synthetase
MGRRGEDDPAALWRAFTERHPDLRTIDLVLPDLAGVARGKRLTGEAFASGLAAGFTFSTSIYAMDTTGANVAASGLIWEEGDADRPCALAWQTLAPVPWRDGGAQILGGLVEPDGSPFFANPRAALARATDALAAQGLRAIAAIELEFYLLERASLASGAPRPPAQADGRRPSGVQVYGLDELDDQAAFLERLAACCRAQSLPAKGAVAEYAPGQYEINLGHGDPLAAADHAFLLKRAVRAAAHAEGLEATFMAKPLAGQSSSGMHVHVSLLDAAGGNAFAADARLLEHAIGGLQASMAEAMLIFAPNANSYRRFRPGSYAPLAPSWGRNNRTVALRVPAGPESARRIEHRVAGADANPYLVLAAVLAGIAHGLERRLDPGPPITGNAYEQLPPSLPLSWETAIAAFASDGILAQHLGPGFCRVYRACRAAERDRFEDTITPLEHAWYLRTV